VSPQKIRKVDKEELYLKLIETGLSFDEIADMNYHRQNVLFRGPKTRTFETEEELRAWQASRQQSIR
jgi:hypothetical protein